MSRRGRARARTTAADGTVELFHAAPHGKLAIVVQQENRWLVLEPFDPAAVEGGKVVVR